MESEQRKVYLHLVVGLFALGVLIFVRLYVIEGSYFEHWCNARCYEVLHKIISPFNPEKDLSVVVLDSTDLKREQDGTTSISALQEVVKALVESKAKAIAIDIDFSPRTDPEAVSAGPRAHGDESFFTFLHGQPIPVFVGALNIGPEPVTWLGLEKNKDLAADMIIYDKDTTQLPRWLECGEGVRLNSISMALAEASRSRVTPTPFIKPFLEDPEADRNLELEPMEDLSGKEVPCKQAYVFVNYAKLELLQKLSLPVVNRPSILSSKDEEGKNKFEGKLVLIGDGQRDQEGDSFVVSGRLKPVRGVYLFAAATYTLVDEPIYKLKRWVTVVIDLILGLILVFILFITRWRRLGKNDTSSSIPEGFGILLVAVATILLACALVKFFDVLWLDVSLVVVALLLHSQVQAALLWIPTRIFSRRHHQTPESL